MRTNIDRFVRFISMRNMLDCQTDIQACNSLGETALYLAASITVTRRLFDCCWRRARTSTRRADTTATPCRRRHGNGHEAVVDCCWTRARTSTRRAETTATPCRRRHAMATRRWSIAAGEGRGRQRAGRSTTATPCRRRQCNGHEAVVRLLLEKGADVNAQGGYYGNALQAASVERPSRRWFDCCWRRARTSTRRAETTATPCRRRQRTAIEAVVRLLLEKGADVNAQGGYYGNALQAASARGHEAVVRLLLDKGARFSDA